MSTKKFRKHRVLVAGSTGTIGRSVVRELVSREYEVVCIARPHDKIENNQAQPNFTTNFTNTELRYADVTDVSSLLNNGFCEQQFDAVISCLASRTGVSHDAWAIDYQANMNLLSLAKKFGVKHMILLSAICVQKPLLAFQFAKLEFESKLIESGICYSIIRPTAFFKSLSGQIARVQRGKSFVVFGNGTLTACKPISNADLAKYIADSLEDSSLQNKILPIGGPGPAITPIQQGEELFRLLGLKPRYTHVPVSILKGLAFLLSSVGKLVPKLAVKAERARIGHYYATESMLVMNPETGHYDAASTPETGKDLLFDHYQRVLNGEKQIDW